ncbi:MAG: bifunctional phosphoribosyl-AMP cyclohydrolase/phosphoribosyl-ATP diphosphatase HisIE [Nitrospirae bacterium]|nr:bifunctional phosphoribosyl-AMP cyclohydrolase/phosphoribosyl-ATP diphosphatase HisIE [Nitrospirota bacterium]MBI5695999.1 bifunctional phosphoribosyl-AMP cyclohydrolase/phosphoribosyl-ATP diphosphatase HisIE [Nitrospirota bacterium]
MFDITTLKFDSHGLIPAIVQDHENGDVLMMAFMNETSVGLTLETGLCHYWSRSRNKLWLKGETSGHTQAVKSMYFDCDADCLLVKVEQKTAACHTGHRSCFYSKIEADGIKDTGETVFAESDVYSGSDILDKVYTVILDRKANPREGSYVNRLTSHGPDGALKKVGEEATELVLAAKSGDKAELVRETADLWFHTLVALADAGVSPVDVYAELKKRRG